MSFTAEYILSHVFAEYFTYDSKYNELTVSQSFCKKVIMSHPLSIRELFYDVYPTVINKHKQLATVFDMNDYDRTMTRDSELKYINSGVIDLSNIHDRVFNKLLDTDYHFIQLTEKNDISHYKIQHLVKYNTPEIKDWNVNHYLETGLKQVEDINHLPFVEKILSTEVIKKNFNILNNKNIVDRYFDDFENTFAGVDIDAKLVNTYIDKLIISGVEKKISRYIYISPMKVMSYYVLIKYKPSTDVILSMYFSEFDMDDPKIDYRQLFNNYITIITMHKLPLYSAIFDRYITDKIDERVLENIVRYYLVSGLVIYPGWITKILEITEHRKLYSIQLIMLECEVANNKDSVNTEVVKHNVERYTERYINMMNTHGRIIPDEHIELLKFPCSILTNYIKREDKTLSETMLARLSLMEKIYYSIDVDFPVDMFISDLNGIDILRYLARVIKIRHNTIRVHLKLLEAKNKCFDNTLSYDSDNLTLCMLYLKTVHREPPLEIYHAPSVNVCGNNNERIWTKYVNNDVPREMKDNRYYDYMCFNHGARRPPNVTSVYIYFSNSIENKIIFMDDAYELSEPAIKTYLINVPYRKIKEFLTRELMTNNICMFTEVKDKDWMKISGGNEKLDIVAFSDYKDIYRNRTPLNKLLVYIKQALEVSFDIDISTI